MVSSASDALVNLAAGLEKKPRTQEKTIQGSRSKNKDGGLFDNRKELLSEEARKGLIWEDKAKEDELVYSRGPRRAQ